MELAKLCVRTSHVVKTVAEGNDGDNSSGPSKQQIEDLSRCVNPAKPSLLGITSDIRTVRHIESAVRERANRSRYSREHHPGSTGERVIAWRAELLEILNLYDVHRRQLTTSVPITPQLPKVDPGRGSALGVREIEHCVQRSVDVEPPAPVPVVVRRCFAAPAPLPLLITCSI